MEIYLIRHTTPKVQKGICYGQTDLEIENLKFQEELEFIQSKLPSDIDAFYSSPLKRCKTLGDHFSPKINLDDRLMEMNFGEWENRNWSQIPIRELQPWMDDFVNVPTKNGENFIDLHQRNCDFIDELLELNFSKTAIFTHAGNIRCFISFALDLPLKNAFRIQLQYASIVHLRIEKDKNFCQVFSIS